MLNALGWVHSYVGDTITAIDHFNRAIRINPLDPMIGQVRCGLGAALLMSGRVEESVATLEQALAEAPEYTASLVGSCLAATGSWAGSTRRGSFGQKLLAREPGMTISETLRDSPSPVPEMLGRMERGLRGIGIPE